MIKTHFSWFCFEYRRWSTVAQIFKFYKAIRRMSRSFATESYRQCKQGKSKATLNDGLLQGLEPAALTLG